MSLGWTPGKLTLLCLLVVCTLPQSVDAQTLDQEQLIACPASPEQEQIDGIRANLADIHTQDPSESLPTTALIRRIQGMFDLRDSALTTGDCDSSNYDREIIRLAELLQDQIGDGEPATVSTDDWKSASAETVIVDTTASSTAVDVDDDSAVTPSKFITRLLNYLLAKYIEKDRQRRRESVENSDIPSVPPPGPNAVLLGRVRVLPVNLTGKPEAVWDHASPLRGAKVYVKEWNLTTFTDNSGSFRVEGRPRPVHVQIAAEGHQDGHMVLFVPPGDFRRNFMLKAIDRPKPPPKIVAGVVKAGKRSGQFVSRDEWNRARPVEGAWVSIDGSGTRIRTSADGRFAFAGLGAPVSITISSSKYPPTKGKIAPGKEAQILLTSVSDLPGKPPPPPRGGPQGKAPATLAIIRGVVRGGRAGGDIPLPTEVAHMRPVAGARVTALEWNITTMTGSDGSYEIRALRTSNKPVTVEVRAPSFKRRQVSVQPGATTTHIYLRSAP